jgi:hypothetical protein
VAGQSEQSEQSEQRGGAEQEEGSSLGDPYPYPFTSEVFENSLKEVPAGARLAIRTCLQHWREKVSGGKPLSSAQTGRDRENNQDLSASSEANAGPTASLFCVQRSDAVSVDRLWHSLSVSMLRSQTQDPQQPFAHVCALCDQRPPRCAHVPLTHNRNSKRPASSHSW